ncbi:putative protein VTS1 [Schistosoma mansoni]|uniref:putative protein VTS1 n=1 Tax=Schistosoma mansoni TaxID=6183 RepID=UPI0001A63AD4|nr:putative protein VTS1 [Schistosoma mansoni]|eukprot:XP_018652540.1 putative protein VTS1 [Schistosoma mansoni]
MYFSNNIYSPRDYVPPFKSSIRSSNRTKRRTGVGTNYKPNLTNHLTTNDCNWKSTTNGRHRLRGRASNSPAVNNNNGNGIETISTTNRCNTHHLTKIDTEKELINDNVIQEDTDITKCLPHVSDEEHLTRSSSNRKSKLHNKSRKLFRGSSTSSSDCPSEILPDLEKLSEIGDFPGKTDGILCDPSNPDHSRPQTPSCMSNNTNNPDKNNNDHVCFEENDELHETFPIGCPIDGCKKRFSHVLALRFHLNHTSHCNLLDSHKKRPSSIDLKKQDFTDTTSIMTTTTTTDTNDNKNNNSAENGGQQQQQLSNKLSHPNMKIDNNHNNSTVMNYSRYSSGSTQHYGSLDQQSIKSELNNDYMMNLTMCHTLSNTTATATTTMSTTSKWKNLTVNQQELNTSLSNNNMIPSFLLQNAWNLQLPTSSTYTQSMPLSFNNSNKEDELKSTMNSLTNGLPSSLYLSTYSNMPTLTSSGSVVNNSPINTMPCSSTPSLSMYEMSTASQPFNDSKQYIPSNHHHLLGTSNQSADLNTTTNSMYYGIPDFLVAALSTLASNASSYSCIPEPFKSYFNQNSLMNNTTNPINTTHLNSNGNSISKVTNLSSSNMSPSNSGILDGTINNRFFNSQFFQNYGTNLSNVQNFQSFNNNNNGGGGAGNLTLNPERLDPLKLSAGYLMQYTNPDTTQLLSSSVSSSSVTSTYGNSILP